MKTFSGTSFLATGLLLRWHLILCAPLLRSHMLATWNSRLMPQKQVSNCRILPGLCFAVTVMRDRFGLQLSVLSCHCDPPSVHSPILGPSKLTRWLHDRHTKTHTLGRETEDMSPKWGGDVSQQSVLLLVDTTQLTKLTRTLCTAEGNSADTCSGCTFRAFFRCQHHRKHGQAATHRIVEAVGGTVSPTKPRCESPVENHVARTRHFSESFGWSRSMVSRGDGGQVAICAVRLLLAGGSSASSCCQVFLGV